MCVCERGCFSCVCCVCVCFGVCFRVSSCPLFFSCFALLLSLSLSIWWGINIHLTSQLNATRILKPGNADPNDNIMIYRQQTLLKSCRDATLGRDNTLAPNATPLPRISPALTQNESIDYDDTLDPLGWLPTSYVPCSNRHRSCPIKPRARRILR